MEHMACGLGELKFAEGGDMAFAGYGAVFGNIDAYGDVILPGAFAETIAEAKRANRWPAMLLQHGGFLGGAEDLTPIGIWTELAEDGVGLKVEGRLAETPRGREAYALLKMEPRPAIDGLSIGYVAKEWEARTKPEEPRRKLKRIELHEVSLVTFPANPRARVSSVKSARGLTITDAERALRDAGFSRAEAKAIVARGFEALALREADAEGDLDRRLRGLIATMCGD